MLHLVQHYCNTIRCPMLRSLIWNAVLTSCLVQLPTSWALAVKPIWFQQCLNYIYRSTLRTVYFYRCSVSKISRDILVKISAFWLSFVFQVRPSGANGSVDFVIHSETVKNQHGSVSIDSSTFRSYYAFSKGIDIRRSTDKTSLWQTRTQTIALKPKQGIASAKNFIPVTSSYPVQNPCHLQISLKEVEQNHLSVCWSFRLTFLFMGKFILFWE